MAYLARHTAIGERRRFLVGYRAPLGRLIEPEDAPRFVLTACPRNSLGKHGVGLRTGSVGIAPLPTRQPLQRRILGDISHETRLDIRDATRDRRDNGLLEGGGELGLAGHG